METYYYAAWIIYRIDRYFARTPESTTLKAAKYHIAMMVSALLNPDLIPIFDAGDTDAAIKKLKSPKKLRFRVSEKALSQEIESSIASAAELTAGLFQHVLAEGRSLRKDDVRSKRSQEALLEKVKIAQGKR